MPLNFSNPVTSQDRAAVLQSIRDHVIALSKMLDGETLSGTTPTGAIRYSSANERFEKWSGVAWAELPLKFLPLGGGTLTGTLNGTTGAFTAVTVSGNAVWHAGNLNPANYLGVNATARRANAVPTADPGLGAGDIYVGNNVLTFKDSTNTARTAWHSGNFNPASYQLASSAWNTSNFNPADYQPLSSAWNSANFNPANYAPLAGAAFTGNTTSTTTFAAPLLAAETANAEVRIANRTTPAQSWSLYVLTDTYRVAKNGTGDRMTLDASGNMTCVGNFTAGGNVGAYSDWRLKTRVEDFRLHADELFDVRAIEYTRTDTGRREVGLFAHEARRAIPLAVSEDADGMLSLDYGRFAAIAVVNLARELRAKGVL